MSYRIVAMKELRFSKCTLELLEETFGLRKVFTSSVMDEWLSRVVEVSDEEIMEVNLFRSRLEKNFDSWNEEELREQFIGPIFAIVDPNIPYRFRYFAKRKLEGQVGDCLLYGEPDGMIAGGYRSPKQPYFSFQEYKREIDPDGDPAGQCLAAMLVAQAINKDEKPIYGCYVVGEIWRFLTLEGKKYRISSSYSAASSEVIEVYKVLKNLKNIIFERTAVFAALEEE
jgi:hypothetical protein